MQIADLTVPNEMRTAPVVSSFPAAASDFFRLLETVMRGDVGAAQALPLLADDSGLPSSGSVVPDMPADPSTPLRTGLSETMTMGGQSGDGRDGTALDQSGTALALALLAGMVNMAAFERLAEGPFAVLTPVGADAFDPAAVSQFSEASEEAMPLASISVLADQHPLVAEPQGSVGHASSLAVPLSIADAISLTPARVIEEPPRGPGEEGSVRVVAPQGKPILSSVEASPELGRRGPVLSSSTTPTTGAAGGSGGQSPTIPELLVPQPAIGRGEGVVDNGLALLTIDSVEGPVLNLVEGAAPFIVPDASAELPRDQRLTLAEISAPVLRGSAPLTPGGSAPLTTGLVEGGHITPRLSTESAGLPMMAFDETADSGDGTTAITMFHDPSDGTATEERPQLAAQPGALRDRPGVGQERLSSGSGGEDGSRGLSLPAQGSDRGHGSGPNSGEVSSTRADLRPGSSAVAERDRSLTLQVMQQIVAAARLGLREDGTSVRLRLRPESLGELLIKISWKEKGIVAGIQAENPVTARMLQEDLGHLKAALGERGITVNDLGVQVGVDLRHGRAYDDRLPATTTSGMAHEALPWLPQDEARPLASLIQREGLIDIRV